jgi:hypothetical protein
MWSVFLHVTGITDIVIQPGAGGPQGPMGPIGQALEPPTEAIEPLGLLQTAPQTRLVTVGALIDGNGAVVTTGVRPIWRVPYPCRVTAVRAYADIGTTTVVNAGEITDGDFCSSNITVDPSDAWEVGAPNQNLDLIEGDTLYVEITTAGTATQVTIQVDVMARPQ